MAEVIALLRLHCAHAKGAYPAFAGAPHLVAMPIIYKLNGPGIATGSLENAQLCGGGFGPYGIVLHPNGYPCGPH